MSDKRAQLLLQRARMLRSDFEDARQLADSMIAHTDDPALRRKVEQMRASGEEVLERVTAFILAVERDEEDARTDPPE